MLAGALICCAGVWRYAAALPQPTTAPEPMGRRIVGEVKEILRNRLFRTLFFSMVIFATSAGVHSAVQNHNYVFVWKLRPEWIQWTTYSYLGGILVGVPLTPLLLRTLEKKTVVLVGFTLVIAAFSLLPGLRAAGVVTLSGLPALSWLALTTFVVGIGSGLVFIAYPSMMADAADEHEHVFGARREGLFFSGLGFAGKAAGGMGLLFGGLALDLMRFPRAVGRQVDAVVAEDVLRSLAVTWGPLSALLSLIGALVFLPYAITRARQAEVAAALKLKRAEDVSAGRSS